MCVRVGGCWEGPAVVMSHLVLCMVDSRLIFPIATTALNPITCEHDMRNAVILLCGNINSQLETSLNPRSNSVEFKLLIAIASRSHETT